ncbi:MAG TPA: hypothetical protein VLM42_02635 [Bryobacteraceae bacterium]|nr:hypothetical protein [Bryobacteraceae bacterium]
MFAWIYEAGLTSDILVTLQVKGRTSGRLFSTVLVMASYREAFIKRGPSRPVTLTEIPPGKKAPILKVWCQVATSGREYLPVRYAAPASAFEAIAADYPVFRIDPAR